MAERKIISFLAAFLFLAATPAFAVKVEISTDRKSYSRNEEIRVTVTVTDDDGNPVETALTCAAYRTRKGSEDSSGEWKPETQRSYTDIFSMIGQKKPFRLVDNRIVFSSVGPNTNNRQDGALLVLNGSVLGQDASMIQFLNPSDVERINISTDFADIQKYTGFNTMGVIEIYTKSGRRGQEPDPATGKGSPDMPAKPVGGRLIYSNTEIRTDSSGTAAFVFPAWKRASDVVIIVTTAEPAANPSSGRLAVTVR